MWSFKAWRQRRLLARHPVADSTWAAVHAQLPILDGLDAVEEPPIDAYAGENPAEFFAVCSEYFFSAPDLLVAAYPQVYQQLQAFYRQDPLARLQRLHGHPHAPHTRPMA